MRAARQRRVGTISLVAMILVGFIAVTLWTPGYVNGPLAVVALLSGPFIGAGLDTLEDRRHLQLAVLRRRAMFGDRPLTRAESRQLHRLLERYSPRIEREATAA